MEQQETVETEREAYSAPSCKQFCFETSGLAQMSGNRESSRGNDGDWTEGVKEL